MAEVAAVVVPIIQPLINKLSSGIWREMKLNNDIKKDLEKLKRLLETINNVLEDAERRSVSNVALRGWLRDIKDVAFDADDVVDDFQTEALRRHYLNLNTNGKVRNFFSSNNPTLFLHKMANEIKDVLNRFDELARLRRYYHLKEGSSSSSEEEILRRETYSSVIESEVYGRDEEKEKIINFLVNMDNDKDLPVLPIVGLGGIGKTTLAQLVCNDRRIKEHFEMVKWVCVDEHFDVKNIISAIVNDTNTSRLEDLQQRLRAKIGEKRLLLVLDDAWNENSEEWERLKNLLKGGKLGSKIIVTTRSEIVATIMGTTETPHKVESLSYDNCWNLFRMRAFGPGKAEESSRLIEIGKEIVEKCGGLPLAAKSLGGLMATKRGVVEWTTIKNSEIWDLPLKDDKNILPSLKLSYDHLSSKLKQCFAYCSVFPKDWKLEKLKLIQLWIAEGFVQSTDEDVPPVEDIGSQYFNILLQRSFLQNEETNDYGEVISCKMHDLVHDLACLVSKGEFSTVQTTGNTSLVGRYSSVICHDYNIDKLDLHIGNEAKKLRSLHILLDYSFVLAKECELELGPVSLVTHLRVLDLSGIQMKVLPKIIGKLKHLRFLDISGSLIEELPKSVYSLYNLQTLNLRNCWSLRRLPEGIEKLRSLRHLDIDGCGSLTSMPSGVGRLTALQTLPLFVVSETGWHISELQDLKHIRGEFSIKYLSSLDPREAMAANLGAKANIQSLELQWRIGYPHSPLDEVALENLRPHPNLISLTIYGYGGSRLPYWVSALMLPNLVKLVLEDIDNCESLPSLGQLPLLEHLEVGFMKRLRRMGEEVYGDDGVFPALKYLRLWRLPDLEEWLVPETAGNVNIMFPLLKELMIFDCPKLRVVRPHLPSSLVKLNLRGIDGELLSAGGSLQGLSRLRDLEIVGVTASSNSSTEWGGLQHLTALQNLEISHCAELTKLPEGVGDLTSLRDLTLNECPKLEQLPDSLQRLTALQNLEISECSELTKLSEGIGDLTSLRDLSLFYCPKLEQLPDSLQRLTALQNLMIHKCGELTKLPESVGDLTSLRHLTLEWCCKLEQLPDSLQRLTALQSLEISGCGELTKLPEGVGDLTSLRDLKIYSCPKLEQLPDSLQRLTGLQRLEIRDCVLLKIRCEKVTGEDWHKIAHIPKLQI